MNRSSATSGAPSERVRSRVIQSTQRLLAEEGLGISMDQIAASAGVGRRSLFRHFGSRDALIARALEEAVSASGERLAALLSADAPLGDWLAGVLCEVQRSQLEAGRGYWELTASSDDQLSPQLAAVNRDRRASRRRWAEDVSRRAWSLAGGEDPPPDVVIEAFALTLSRHAVRSLVEEFGLPPERAVKTNAAMLTALIQAEQQRLAVRSEERPR
ncbi:MAG TPA: TetR/AcrR family transcriptional regulator [Acidimicrobiia bacterium]|nr:TetR/AcrR family transcriptional regulator [Acidimicrobiia bacterium]